MMTENNHPKPELIYRAPVGVSRSGWEAYSTDVLYYVKRSFPYDIPVCFADYVEFYLTGIRVEDNNANVPGTFLELVLANRLYGTFALSSLISTVSIQPLMIVPAHEFVLRFQEYSPASKATLLDLVVVLSGVMYRRI